MANNQPTVLVKKADGTFARMTLDEIKQMRGGGSTEVQKPVVPNKSVVRVEESSKTTTLRDPSTSLRSAQDDKKMRMNPVEEVLKKMHFKVSEQLQNRLRSIIQLRLKDIRSSEQTKDKVMQPAIEGGLGLGQKEADELVSVCGIILERDMKNVDLKDVPVLKKKTMLPMVEPNEIPATTTPYNSFKHSEQKVNVKRLDPGSRSGMTIEGHRNDSVVRGNDKGGVLSARPAVKTAMDDVQAPRPVEMGPIEEIQFMNLVDFRRLSAKPTEAAARLKQKFLNLRDESVVLYLDGLGAWHKSPLYADYVKSIIKALKEKRKMSALDGGEMNKIKLEEILAIVNMEKELE